MLICSVALLVCLFALSSAANPRSFSRNPWILALVGFLALSGPFSVFLFDRLNLVLMPVLGLSVAAFMSTRPSRLSSKVLPFAVWLAVLVKPYFVLSLISIRLASRGQPMRSRLALLCFELAVYTSLNQLPFSLSVYSGSIISWFRNIAGFSGAVAPLSLYWDMSHYSVSPIGVFRSLAYTDHLDFLSKWSSTNAASPFALMVGVGISVLIAVSLLAYFRAIMAAARCRPLGSKPDDSLCQANSVSLVVAALIPVFILLALLPQLGYYTAAVVLPLLLLVVACSSAERIRFLIGLLVSIVLLGGVEASPLSSVASLILYWITCLFSLHLIFVWLKRQARSGVPLASPDLV
jgi:hypothetical protein